MHEFDLIHRYFRPLAQGFSGSLNLGDDAALIQAPEGHELVITKDAISAGVHFIGHEDAALVAKKLLRVNLSDLAAKGATPLCYFLALMLPRDTEEAWVKRFAEGLAEDQKLFNIHLAGGDTIATRGPLSCSITALGTVPDGAMLRRNTARPGDILFVSGTLGDSALGLKLLQAHAAPAFSEAEKDFLQNRYLLPQPRLTLGQQLHGIASACMDVSDGLVQDLGHICAASGVGAVIEAQKLPVSQAAYHAIETTPEWGLLVFSGGDDYELLFTVPPDKSHLVPADCARIGEITEGNGVIVRGDDGQPMELKHKGFRHF